MFNIMMDIETLGILPNSVTLSIAAVKFNFGDEQEDVFQVNIDLKSSLDAGFVTEKDTVEWWKKQPPEVIKASMVNAVPIEAALDKFNAFVGPDWEKIVFWMNGENFDAPHLEWKYRALNKTVPWKYYNLRDARTIYSVFGINMKEFPRIGDYHNPVDDCRTQIKALKQALS